MALAIPAAQAESWDARDAHRDVGSLSYSPDPTPCGTFADATVPADRRRDITGLSVEHATDTVTIRMSLRAVGKRRDDTSYTFHLLAPRGAFRLVTFRDEHGRLSALFTKEFKPPGSRDDDCGITTSIGNAGRPCEDVTARADARRDLVEVTVARTCLKDPRWVKVGAEDSGGFTGSLEAGFVVFSDEWTPPGVVATGFLPPYGPRVRRG
jgi:hypothetical protein